MAVCSLEADGNGAHRTDAKSPETPRQTQKEGRAVISLYVMPISLYATLMAFLLMQCRFS